MAVERAQVVRAGRKACAALFASLALTWSGEVRAGDPDAYATMPFTTTHEAHHARAGLEIGAILGVGLVDYLLNTGARGGTMRAGERRWSLRYDWPTLREKLVGTGLDLDTNKHATNYASHPFAGTLYYSAARSNHLSFAESYLFAALASSTWEYFGEIRETTSANDLIVTPSSGAAIGEATIQLSSFFQRSAPRSLAGQLGFIANPVNASNTWLDDVTPLRRDVHWHRFVLSAGAGATVQQGPRTTHFEQRLDLDFRLAHLPGYDGPGHEEHLFDDGNMSSIRLELVRDVESPTHALFATRVVPVGVWLRDADVHGGWGGLLGLRLGFEYGMHVYDRAGSRVPDVWSVVSPAGFAAEVQWSRRDVRVRSTLDLAGAMSGVTPFGLRDYLRGRDTAALEPTIQEQGYYHALTASVAGGLEASAGLFTLASDVRLDDHRPVVELGSVPIRDQRLVAHGAASVRAGRTPLRLSLEAQRTQREGRVGPAEARRIELAAWASLGVEL